MPILDHLSPTLAPGFASKSSKQSAATLGATRQTRPWRRPAIWLSSFILALVLSINASAVSYARANPPTPMTFVVTNTDDSGPGSLRQAVLDANANSGPDDIEFDLTGCPCTISLTSGQLEINDDVTISGPGWNPNLTMEVIVTANNASRIFLINAGAVTISGLSLEGGYAGDSEVGGGAILNWSSDPLTLTDLLILYNQATGSGSVGGAVANFTAPLTLARVVFGFSSADYGGTVYSETGAVTVTDSLFVYGFSQYGGGGILLGNVFCNNHQTLCSPEALKDNQRPGEEAVLTNVTFIVSYESPGSLGGGALLTAVPATLAHVTMLDNGSDQGVGHAIAAYADVTVLNTLIANSYGATDNCYGSIIDGGGNLSWPDTSCPGLNSDPMIDSFEYLGGPNPTLVASLQPGSPALDAIPAGSNGCGDVYTTDQRGLPRPQNGACDIGAYEAQKVCAVVADSTYTINGVQFYIQPGGAGDIDCLEVQPFAEDHPNATPGLQTGAYWRINVTNASGDPASGYMVDLTITTPFVPSAQDKLCRYTGSTWDCMASGFDAGLQTITRQNVTEFSDWAAGNANPLAVSLSQVGSAPQSGALWMLSVAMLLLGIFSWRLFVRRPQ